MELPFFWVHMPLFFKIMTIFWSSLFLSIVPLFFMYRYWFFLRNPERKIPDGPNIISPADGYVIYIKEINNNKEVPLSVKKGQKIFLNELMDDAEVDYNLVIGIFMTPFSVHYNRAPFSGKVVKNYYRSTKENKSMLRAFLNLIFNLKPYTENSDYITENERNTLVIKNDTIRAAVVQIATKWVDLIKNNVMKEGDSLTKGDLFGMIRMGSQCDLFLKINNKYEIKVKEGQYVKAGSSVLIDLDV